MILPIFLSVLSSIIGSFGAIYLKKASNNGILNKDLIIGFILYITGILTFVPALMFGELSILYPIISLSYVWVALISIKVFNDRMSNIKWIGIILIILGVFLVTL